MLLTKYHWDIKTASDPEAVRQLAKTLDVPMAGARFLAARSYTTPALAREYLFADDTQPHDPFQFEHMERAVACVTDTIAAKKRIMIHGDYDVDGICGTALLYHFLSGTVPDVYRFVPDRRKDGYGIAERAVEWALKNGVGLMIAVDCGTSDGELIGRLEAAGIEVVVCDHHEFPAHGGAKGIMLNPVRSGEAYPFPGLCGAGVAFKLVRALEERGVKGKVSSAGLLDLVCMATVGDLAPLIDENRLYVRAGLESLSKSKRTGIQALKSIAGLDSPEVTSRNVGFTLAPRINAPGRIASPKPSLQILCTDDPKEARRLAGQLERENAKRRSLTDQVKDDVLGIIDKMGDRDDRGGFVLAGSEWDEGVLGIAAARVVEEFGKPAILISLASGHGKGSGRSVPGVHLKEQLDKCETHLERYGGHAQAVGLSIEPEKIDGFVDALSEQFKVATASLPKRPVLKIDAELGLHECSLGLLDFLSVCEPFGQGNKSPVWRIRDVVVTPETRYVGDGHLKTFLRGADGSTGEAISFNWQRRGVEPEALHGMAVDIAVTLKKGFYQKKFYPELQILDMCEYKE